MKKVICMEDKTEFYFDTNNGYDAMRKMLYTLNLSFFDKSAKIQLFNNRTYALEHNGKTYACLK